MATMQKVFTPGQNNDRKVTFFQYSASSTVTIKPTMRVAHVNAWDESPKYSETDVPDCPEPETGECQIQVNGAAVHTLVRLRTSGRHYSAKTLPHVPGVDGVGIDSTGIEVYFFNFGPKTGSFAEIVNVPESNIIPLPTGMDKLQVAGLVNPAMSSWMALRRRAVFLPPNFSVLILGTNSISGRLAISMARSLGASKVVGCARNESKMAELGLDESIRLQDPASETDFSSVGHVDIILDYLYAIPAVTLLQSLNTSKTVQYINVGDLAGREIVLPSHVMRSRKLVMMASGVGSWTVDELRQELPELLKAMKTLPKQALKILPLCDIEKRWNDKFSDKVIFVP